MEIGTPLQIVITGNGEQDEQYRSKLIDKNKKYFIIDYPTKVATNRTAILPMNTWIKVSFVDKRKNVYQFTSKIAKRVKVSNVPGLAIIRPDQEHMKRIQRRNYVRIHTAVNVAIHSVYHSFSPLVTVTNDISGGGLSVILPEDAEFKSGMQAQLWLVLPRSSGKTNYIDAAAELVDVFEEKNKRRRASFKFTNIDEEDRQAIITFVFEKQREERRKEYL